MNKIETIADLENLYDVVNPRSLQKVVTELTPLYRQWIEAARFCVLTTVGPEGTDGSPRGDVDPVVRIMDGRTLWMPDWRGNNRMDSLRNIVRDGRVSLMFMIPGSTTVVRVNGTAILTADPEITQSFDQRGTHPRSVIAITVGEAYFQCAKAIMRGGIWDAGPRAAVPTAGDFLKEQKAIEDAASYDDGYAEYAKSRMW